MEKQVLCFWKVKCIYCIFFPMALQSLVGQGILIIEAAQSHSVRHTTLGRTLLDEWSAQHRGLYLTTYNTDKGQKSMLLEKFKHTYSQIKTWRHSKPATIGKSDWEAMTSVTLENWYQQVNRQAEIIQGVQLLPRVYQHVRCYKIEYHLERCRATTGAHI
jgi:hypothetical protein